MRHLSVLLCALLLAVGLSVPTPAHAFGNDSHDVAPTISAGCASNYCYLHVHEFDSTNRTLTYIKRYDSRLGWSGWDIDNLLPSGATLAGNLTELPGLASEYTQEKWMVDGASNLWCRDSGGGWQSYGGGWDVDAKRATPAMTRDSGQEVAAAEIPQADGAGNKIFEARIPYCGSGAVFAEIPGRTAWSASLTSMSNGIHTCMIGTGGDVYQFSANVLQGLGGLSGGSVSCVSRDNNDSIDVFIRGLGNDLLHRGFWGPIGWQPWESLGQPPGTTGLRSGPNCASWSVGRVDCVAIGDDGTSVWHIAWDSTVGWLPWQKLDA